ncbi:MAG TPA: cytochrome P450 [Ilumatobacteraceae bacterium]|nr:cytochrome P450 [Ilumatobacteraceae bacterium]
MTEMLFNPFDPAFRANPYPFYERLRTTDPVHVSAFGFTVLTRYDDVARTLRGNEFARDIEAHVADRPDDPRRARRERQRQRVDEGLVAKSILNLDPPDHTRLRRLVSLAFTPTAIERLRPRVQQLVDDALDRAAERGSMELVEELAFPVPFQVISDLLALPTDGSEQIREWSQTLTASLEPTADDATLDATEVAAGHMGAYLGEVIEHRRHHLGEDLLSALIQAEEEGDRLSPAELLSFVILLYVAGHETTVNLIGNGTLALLRNPDEMRRWAADPSLDVRALDELLRFDGPVQQTVRVPMIDVGYQAIDGSEVVVPKGTLVMTVLGAASHDPAVFEKPEELHLDRTNANRHLGFAAGVHYCLGASLAKLEAGVAITSLIRRFPQVALAGDPTWRDRLTIRGVDHLPLALR